MSNYIRGREEDQLISYSYVSVINTTSQGNYDSFDYQEKQFTTNQSFIKRVLTIDKNIKESLNDFNCPT